MFIEGNLDIMNESEDFDIVDEEMVNVEMSEDFDV